MIREQHNPDAQPRSVLHIGLPKTASTSLQRQFFSKHPELFYMGKNPPPNVFGSDVMKYILVTAKDGLESGAKLEECKSLFEDFVRPHREAGLMPLWSDEEMTVCKAGVVRARAQAIRDIVGPTKVIMVIRHPLRMLESFYLFMLCNHQIDRESIMLSTGLRRKFLSPLRYYTFEEWINYMGLHYRDEKSFTLDMLIDASQIARIYSDVFGRDSLGIFLFEDLKDDAEQFGRTLCRFLGISERGVPRAHDRRQENPRPSMHTLQRLQKIATSPLQRAMFRCGPQRLRNKMTGYARRLHEDAVLPARVEMPAAISQEVEYKVRDGNRWLMEEWGLPLDRYGYPI